MRFWIRHPAAFVFVSSFAVADLAWHIGLRKPVLEWFTGEHPDKVES